MDLEEDSSVLYKGVEKPPVPSLQSVILVFLGIKKFPEEIDGLPLASPVSFLFLETSVSADIVPSVDDGSCEEETRIGVFLKGWNLAWFLQEWVLNRMEP